MTSTPVSTPAPAPVGDETDLAQQLLVAEVALPGQPTAPAVPSPPELTIAAGDRVLGKMYERLTQWLGGDGAQALFARALDLTRVAHPLLANARLEPHGEHHRPGLVELPERVGDRDAAEVTAAVVALIAAVIALLTRLIGADLTARLLEQIRPDSPPDAAPATPPDTRLAPHGEDLTSPTPPHEDAPID